MKIQRNNRIWTLFVATLIIFAGILFFGNYSEVKAGTCKTISSDGKIIITTVSSPEECVGEYDSGNEEPAPEPGPPSTPPPVTEEPRGKAFENAQHNPTGRKSGICDTLAFDSGKKLITCPLLGVLEMTGSILHLSISLFNTAINPDNVRGTLDNDAIRKTWELVRDLCNIAFILILIFSAFATIFQVDKYNYKKILLWLIIIALLVNFSYPIARFIIDASNSLMYSVLNMVFSDNLTLTTGTAQKEAILPVSSLEKIIAPTNPTPAISGLLLSIIFIFILAMTVLALALILIIRILALAIIIILSPIGFVGTIIGKDGGWWNHLFKYAMAGPIVALVLLLAVELMAATTDLGNLSGSTTGIEPSLIIHMSRFTIPIIILWMGIAMAVKGIEGAGTILGKAQGFAKWVGKLPGRGAKTYLKKLDRDHFGVRGAIKAWKDRTAELETDKVGYQTARARDWMGSIFDRGKRDSKFYRDVNDSNMKAKYKKEQDLFSTTDVDVIAGINKLKGKNDRESTLRREAFFETLAGNKDLNEWSKHKLKEFDPELAKNSIYEEFGGDKNEKDAVDVLHSLSDLNQINGVYSMCGMTYDITKDNTYDEDGNVIKGKEGDVDRIGQRRKSTEDEQIDAAFSKMKQIDYQKMMIGLHADSIVTEGADGKGDGVHKFGLKALEFIESKNAKFVEDRWRGDTGEKIYQGLSANPEVAARFPLIMGILEKQFGSKPAPAPKPATEAKPKEEPKKAEPAKEEEPLIKVVNKYSPLK